MAAVDLDGMTVQELRVLAEAATAEAQEKTEAAKLAELGVDLNALLKAPPFRKAHPAAALPVKYCGPKGRSWSGGGKLPAWLAEAEKQRRKRDEFKVQGSRLRRA